MRYLIALLTLAACAGGEIVEPDEPTYQVVCTDLNGIELGRSPTYVGQFLMVKDDDGRLYEIRASTYYADRINDDVMDLCIATGDCPPTNGDGMVVINCTEIRR